MDSENSIILSGRIEEAPVFDHTVLGEAFYKTRVAARRLSGTEDVLPVTLSERLLTEASPEPGSFVTIDGQLRSYNRRDGAGRHLIVTVFAREARFQAGPIPDENDVYLIGRVCKPAVYRTTPFMREIADLLLAVPRRYGKSDYLPVIAWGRNARFASALETGDRVALTGRMQSRVYRKQLESGESEERTAYEISVSGMERV